MHHPRIRTNGLLTQQTGPDLIVFDQQRRISHALNRTAALIFTHADGSRSVAELTALLQAELNEAADEDLVVMTLAKLRRAHLLEEAGARSAEALRSSRRRFVRKIGLIGSLTLLLPVVETVVAPQVAMAQSGTSCSSDTATGCTTDSSCLTNECFSDSGCESDTGCGCDPCGTVPCYNCQTRVDGCASDTGCDSGSASDSACGCESASSFCASA